MSSALDVLRQSNEYPVVFIGSGISKRYLASFPSWEELLQRFWKQLNMDVDFYAFLNQLRNEIKERMQTVSDNELAYYTNIEAGSIIETTFNKRFYAQEITIEDFTQQQAYRTQISPFKKAISNEFNRYSLREGLEEEYPLFQAFLNKTQIILTTNYDNFIEDSFNAVNPNGIKKYIGQKGFFEQSIGWAEIYKIHGSVEEPDSIVISREDYKRFDKNSVLISAKIISLLVHSPIIFLGYSLTDLNVRKIIQDFSTSLTPLDIKKMSSRIIIVDRVEGVQDLLERTVYDKELGCEYSVIQTDNFTALYERIIQINQGVSPSEVRRFQQVIKKLIVDSGKKGSLNALLIAPEQLEEIEKRIGDENLVVALGDTTYIFRTPDLLSYVEDYIFNKNEIPTEIALRYVASQGSTAKIPFFKHVESVDIDKTGLNPVEKEKLKQRVARYQNLSSCTSGILSSYTIKMNSLEEILESSYNASKEQDIIAYNIDKLGRSQIEEYIKEKIVAAKLAGVASLPTQMRRLLLAYDYLYVKNKEAIAEPPK